MIAATLRYGDAEVVAPRIEGPWTLRVRSTGAVRAQVPCAENLADAVEQAERIVRANPGAFTGLPMPDLTPLRRRLVYRDGFDTPLTVWARSRKEATLIARSRGYRVRAVTDYRKDSDQ